MKQLVESSSTQGTLSGLSGGLADRVLVWLTESEVVVDASQAQAQARNGPPTKITVQYTLYSIGMPMAKALAASPSGTGPFPLCPCPGWGSYLRGSISWLRTAVQHESRRIAWITRSWAACEFLRLDEASGSTFDIDARSMTLGAISAVCQYRSSRALA
jgi:hypothetical protein